MVEQVREELDKAPDQNRQRFDEILANYNKVCSAEKERVIAAGGLHILGTERHESRRIDNQLRGRAGRQGDPGSSRFYLSLEDDLMRIFGADRIQGIMPHPLSRMEAVILPRFGCETETSTAPSPFGRL